jgi:hypothetical protein
MPNSKAIGSNSPDEVRAGPGTATRTRGDDVVRWANEHLLALPTERRLERLEALVLKGVATDSGARAALLGTAKRPPLMLSKLFEEYEAATRDEIKDFSPNQLRVWRTERIRAVKGFVDLIDDKPVAEITIDDGIDYCDWWRKRVFDGETNVKTANKRSGNSAACSRRMSIRRRLNLPEVFKGLRLRGKVDYQ